MARNKELFQSKTILIIMVKGLILKTSQSIKRVFELMIKLKALVINRKNIINSVKEVTL